MAGEDRSDPTTTQMECLFLPDSIFNSIGNDEDPVFWPDLFFVVSIVQADMI